MKSFIQTQRIHTIRLVYSLNTSNLTMRKSSEQVSNFSALFLRCSPQLATQAGNMVSSLISLSLGPSLEKFLSTPAYLRQAHNLFLYPRSPVPPQPSTNPLNSVFKCTPEHQHQIRT